MLKHYIVKWENIIKMGDAINVIMKRAFLMFRITKQYVKRLIQIKLNLIHKIC